MRTIHDLPTPALLLDVDVLEENLRRMSARCKDLGVRLRPHVKTHKCLEIALAQRALGAAGITVSTLTEAKDFAAAGFDDITWAFPVVPGRIGEAEALAHRVRLGVVADSATAIEALARADAPFRVWLKVDCGYGRAGVDHAGPGPETLARRVLEEGLELAGILSHSGNAYRARSRAELTRIAEAEGAAMHALAESLRERDIPIEAVSVGSTPSVAAVSELEGATEVRPGNYALHDYTQVLLGSCAIEDCAATVLASVVSARPERDHCVVDAGALALSLDRGPGHLDRVSFGEVLRADRPATVRNARLTSLSQEHGIVSRHFPVGTRLRILPNHSCLTVACFDAFSVVRGDEVLDSWPVLRHR